MEDVNFERFFNCKERKKAKSRKGDLKMRMRRMMLVSLVLVVAANLKLIVGMQILEVGLHQLVADFVNARVLPLRLVILFDEQRANALEEILSGLRGNQQNASKVSILPSCAAKRDIPSQDIAQDSNASRVSIARMQFSRSTARRD